jgi:hypothetical protein
MRAFKTSIKQKLILIILITSGITLLLASVAFVTIGVISFRENLIKDLSTLAKVVGINSEGALVFDDRFTAERHLSAFRANTGIAYACIYPRFARPVIILKGTICSCSRRSSSKRRRSVRSSFSTAWMKSAVSWPAISPLSASSFWWPFWWR